MDKEPLGAEATDEEVSAQLAAITSAVGPIRRALADLDAIRSASVVLDGLATEEGKQLFAASQAVPDR